MTDIRIGDSKDANIT